MKNLFKKLLACCMAVCMVLTLCVGAITVSAEAATGTVTAGTANIFTTDATAVVPVTAYAAGGIAAAEINVAVPADLSIAKLELATTDANVEVTYASAADPSGAPEVLAAGAAVSEVAPNVIDGVFTYIIHLPANTVTTAEVTVEITFAGTFAEGTTVVDVVDAEACYDANSDLIDLTIVDGAIVVAVAHVCTPGTPVVEKNVDPTCTETGSYDEVVYCTGCGEEMSRKTVTVNALGHAWGEGEVTTAPNCENAGVRTFTCANDPAHTKTEAIDALGHNPGEPAEENRVEAKPGVAGSYDMVVRCTVCNAIISSESFEIEALPVAPVLDEELEFRDIIVTVTSTVNMRYRVFKKDNAAEGKRGFESLGYDAIEVVVTGTAYSFNAANLYNEEAIPETTVNRTGNNSTAQTFLYEGIAMCSLGLKINAYIKAYKDGEYVAYSPMYEKTPEEALRVVLAESTTDGGKASIIELLNMAAAAQTLFGNTKKDSDLGKAVAEGKLVNKNLETSVVTDVPELNVVDYAVNWEAGTEDFQSKLTIEPSLSLTVSPNIRLIVKGKNNLEDTSKVTVDFVYNSPTASDLGAIATKSLTAADGGTLSKRYNFDIPGFEFHNSDKTVTAKIYYDGNLIATVNYSVETYVYEQLNDASASKEAKDLNAAIAKFGFAFRLAKGFATV